MDACIAPSLTQDRPSRGTRRSADVEAEFTHGTDHAGRPTGATTHYRVKGTVYDDGSPQVDTLVGLCGDDDVTLPDEAVTHALLVAAEQALLDAWNGKFNREWEADHGGPDRDE